MTVQCDMNTASSALAFLPPNQEPVDAAPEVEQVAAPEPKCAANHLIDWNQFRPDGTDVGLQNLIELIAKQLVAEIHLGRAQASGGVEMAYRAPSCADSISEDIVVRQRAAVVEASFARGKLLFASDKEVTSGVLENYRTASGLQFAISFDVPNARAPQGAATGMVLGFRETLPVGIDLSKLLSQLRTEFATWLYTWQACREAGKVNLLASLLGKLNAQRSRWITVAMVGACLCLLVPFPYWPQRACVVEPSARSFISSPVDGRVLRSLVRPGDVVEAGQVLGRMDDEQLRLELSAAQAELEQAGKQQDSALAHQEGGKMRMAQLEQQKVALKIQSLQAQLERLELRSPVAGVVLQGEWYRSEGAPVARGDTLFEIAPLEAMTVQVHLTTEDLGEITVDDRATVHVDSANGEKWSGKLTRIDPRASVIDEQIRFVADMEVINRDNRLRPGMKGTVRIDTGYKSIGWLVFHRPYTWLMKNLVW